MSDKPKAYSIPDRLTGSANETNTLTLAELPSFSHSVVQPSGGVAAAGPVRNGLALALAARTLDDALRLLQAMLGIESGDVAAQFVSARGSYRGFEAMWPGEPDVRGLVLLEYLRMELLYAVPDPDTVAVPRPVPLVDWAASRAGDVVQRLPDHEVIMVQRSITSKRAAEAIKGQNPTQRQIWRDNKRLAVVEFRRVK